MNEVIPAIIAALLDCATNICTLIFAGILIPWVVRVGIPWLKDKRLYAIVTIFVKAAEKQAEAGTLGEPKCDYVIRMLERRGIAVTEEVRAMIESAVKELDLAGKKALDKLLEALKKNE